MEDFYTLLVFKASLCVSALQFLNQEEITIPFSFRMSKEFYSYDLWKWKVFSIYSEHVTLQNFSPHSSVKGSRKQCWCGWLMHMDCHYWIGLITREPLGKRSLQRHGRTLKQEDKELLWSFSGHGKRQMYASIPRNLFDLSFSHLIRKIRINDVMIRGALEQGTSRVSLLTALASNRWALKMKLLCLIPEVIVHSFM